MDSTAENSKQAMDRPGPILTIVNIVQRAARWLVGLVILSEEERIKAGVFFGHEWPQG
jgi:hypothetical protein